MFIHPLARECDNSRTVAILIRLSPNQVADDSSDTYFFASNPALLAPTGNGRAFLCQGNTIYLRLRSIGIWVLRKPR
ncbi:MAG: hypothetical protein BMS9Abin05_2743 [Rhodothermia bacterium]|nr:MAG: hypothetical protein BMS9Abin05_2743 [Rhodothermia bacterium]